MRLEEAVQLVEEVVITSSSVLGEVDRSTRARVFYGPIHKIRFTVWISQSQIATLARGWRTPDGLD
jgi:hypothetical protein